MTKQVILNQITDVGVVAVVRALSSEQAILIAKACMKGGLKAIEVTFTVPDAHLVIKKLAETFNQDELLIGAGTVLDHKTAEIAFLAGAQFVVSPGFNLETSLFCNSVNIPYLPGCLTPTEMIVAMNAGCEIIKLFPGSAFGPSYVKSIKGPLPHIKLMPTGGVSLENVDEWIRNGVVAVGIGSELTGPAKTGDYEAVTRLAKDFTERVKLARLNHS